MSFFNLMTLLFTGLKLTGHIDWSWFFVLLPTLVEIALRVTIEMTAGPKKR